MTKEKVLEAIKELPTSFNLDELIERLIVIDKIDAAASQVEEGKVVYHSDVKKKMDEWKK